MNEGREFYQSGGFTKGPNGWLVYVRPAAGQRPPQSGDWAEIIQRSKAFTRPVPVTLVEDQGGAWTFRNGHHQDAPEPITAAVEDFPHPHRQPAMQPRRRTRPGQVPPPPALCLSPVGQEPEEVAPEEEPPEETQQQSWWNRLGL